MNGPWSEAFHRDSGQAVADLFSGPGGRRFGPPP